MKRLLKTLVRPLWVISAPMRRPVIRKFDEHMLRLLSLVARPPETPADLELVLNSVVRELGRLQVQVEILQQQIDDLQARDSDSDHPEGRLSVVGEMG